MFILKTTVKAVWRKKAADGELLSPKSPFTWWREGRRESGLREPMDGLPTWIAAINLNITDWNSQARKSVPDASLPYPETC